MISDQITLGSSTAYLLNSDGQSNLGGTSPSTARTPKLAPNQIWDISGLELLIEATDLTPRLHLPSVLNSPLMEIKIQKEVFPALFTNPFGSRIHNIAGYDDFERGEFVNCFVTEVNKVPTLVSRDFSQCKWKSVIYKLPTTINLSAASWELATSRLVHEDHFEYTIRLFIWHDHNTDRDADEDFELAKSTDADDARNYRFSSAEKPINCRAFQLVFTAIVEVDSSFYESHRMEFNADVDRASTLAGGNIGMPLLRSIRILEQVESNYRFYSLNELIQQAGFYEIFDQLERKINRLILSLDVSAVLVGGEDMADSNGDDYEYLELAILSKDFKRVQAKLVINERLKINPK